MFIFSKKADNVGTFGDVQARKELRVSLKCHDFRWFIENKVPSLSENYIVASGTDQT